MDLFLDCLADAALDTLRLVPFLLVTYFALVALEYKAGAKTREVVARAGAAGPAIGALLGAVPQCGFSAAAAMLYAGRVVTLGTLFAVFLSTSDEMLPLMIAQQADAGLMAQLVLLKVALGMMTGFLVDLAIRVLGLKVQGMGAEFVGSDEPECYQLDSGSVIAIYPDGSATLDGDPFDLDALLAQAGDDEGLTLEEIETGAKAQLAGDIPAEQGLPVSSTAQAAVATCGPGCACGADMGWWGVVREALVRSGEVTFFVFLVTLVLNLVLAFAGEDALTNAISAVPGLSVLVSALVGLIPNCAASVAITQLYLAGVLDLGATMAGLLVSAGIGLLVLFSANRSTKQNLAIRGVLYLIGVVWGFAIQLSGLTL